MRQVIDDRATVSFVGTTAGCKRANDRLRVGFLSWLYIVRAAGAATAPGQRCYHAGSCQLAGFRRQVERYWTRRWRRLTLRCRQPHRGFCQPNPCPKNLRNNSFALAGGWGQTTSNMKLRTCTESPSLIGRQGKRLAGGVVLVCECAHDPNRPPVERERPKGTNIPQFEVLTLDLRAGRQRQEWLYRFGRCPGAGDTRRGTSTKGVSSWASLWAKAEEAAARGAAAVAGKEAAAGARAAKVATGPARRATRPVGVGGTHLRAGSRRFAGSAPISSSSGISASPSA